MCRRILTSPFTMHTRVPAMFYYPGVSCLPPHLAIIVFTIQYAVIFSVLSVPHLRLSRVDHAYSRSVLRVFY